MIPVPSASMAILPAEAPSGMVLAELAARSSTASDRPVMAVDDEGFAVAAAHADDDDALPTTDALAHDSNNSAHVGT